MNNTNTHPLTAQQMLTLHQNSVEIMAKLDQVMTGDQSFVTIEQTNPISGAVTKIEAPTIGNFIARLARIEETMKVLTGMHGNPVAVHVANNAYKRIILADVNLEPNDIATLDSISTFRSDKNWFFDGLMNPALSVEFDLTGKVQQSVRKIQSRRFIVKFSKDANGDLTAAGQARLQEFNDRYKGRNNVDIADFVAWLTNPREGLQNRSSPLLDDQTFDLLPHRLKYNGTFSVLGTEQDTLNKKLWYKLDTLSYQDVGNPFASPVVKQLAVGDEIAVTPNVADQSATTIYVVAEISTVTTDNRVRFERKSGQDPIPVRTAALKMYSPVVYDKRVRITIGYNEYNVVFVKPLHADNHLLSLNWSKGTGFYTSDLRLGSATGTSLENYYVRNVYDYGAVLQDLVAKKIPSDQGIQPLPPNIVEANFKVVQINKHLTDSVDAEKIRELNQQYNAYKSEVDQLQTAVQNKQKHISNKNYASDADRAADQSELNQILEQLTSKNELMSSLIKKILQQQKNLNKIDPKFKVRGFWAIPDPIISAGTTPQEAVQFEVQYKYSSKSGSQPPIEQYQIAPPIELATGATVAPVGATVARKQGIGAFSNWNTYKTDSRKHVQNVETGEWVWLVEDVSSADTPNINQLEISLSPGEKVEIKIRTISEVGWPDAPLISEFSEIITIPFPDDMDSLLTEDDFIVKEAAQEEQRVRFTKDLDSKGVFTHIADTVTIGDTSYAHPSTRISSGFSDENGKMLSTFAMLQKLTARINQLEEAVRRTKGELTVRLFIGQREYPITNGAELDILIEMEDYAKRTQIGTSANPITVNNRRTYLNEVYTMKDMYLLIENSAKENPLGLLSTRTYSSANTASSTPFALVQGDTQAEAQGNWVNDDDTILFNPQTEVTPPTPPTNPPTPPPANETIAAKQIRLGVYTPLKTQFDNQWIWLQAVKPGGTPIYYDGHALIRDRELEQFIPNDAFIHSAVVSDQDHNGGLGGNFGIYSDTKYGKMDSNNAIRINRPSAWKTDNVGSQIGGGSFAASIHPKIQSKNTIIETNTDKVHSIAPGKQGELNIPLNLYWKPNTTHLPFSGTFPMISNITESTYYTVLTVDSTAGIEAGDEIILTGIINTANNQLSSINNVPIVVLGASGSDITIDIGSGGQTLTATTNSITAIGKLAYQGSQNQGVDTITYRGNTGTSLMAESIFRVTSSNAIPQERKRSIRMYMEPENSARPFQFMINFTLRQFKPVSFQSSNN